MENKKQVDKDAERKWKAEVGRRIKEWRLGERIPQYELAEILKIRPASLSAIEAGDNLPSAVTLKGLIGKSVDVIWILTGTTCNEFSQGDNIAKRTSVSERELDALGASIETIRDWHRKICNKAG